MKASPVTIEVIKELPDKRAALKACALYSGKQLKEIAYQIGINDAGHLSKMLNVHADPRHFPPEKENIFMDVCGNEIPLLWSLLKRGYPAPVSVQQLQEENLRQAREIESLKAELENVRAAQKITNIFKALELK